MRRIDANRELVAKLSQLVEKYPDLRFSQILSNLEFIKTEMNADEIKLIDEYYVEPDVILARVKAAFQRITDEASSDRW